MKTVRIVALLASLAVLLAFAVSVARPAARSVEHEPSKPSAALAVSTATQASGHAPEGAADVDEETREAESLLSDLKTTYQHLDGVTVAIGSTPNDEQAVSYYTDGEIVINPNHEASIDEILAHEIWHVIDWRDNGRLDWGESLPPSSSSDYLKR